MAQWPKNPPVNAADSRFVPESARSPGGGNAVSSSILAWEIPWTEKPAGVLKSIGLQRVGHNLSTEQQGFHVANTTVFPLGVLLMFAL